jgi:hypothetical protein
MGDKGKNLSEKEELMMLFSLHDSNKDGFLDGIELRAAFSDMTSSNDFNKDGKDESKYKVTLQQMIDMIDHVIEEDDTDNEYDHKELGGEGFVAASLSVLLAKRSSRFSHP